MRVVSLAREHFGDVQCGMMLPAINPGAFQTLIPESALER